MNSKHLLPLTLALITLCLSAGRGEGTQTASSPIDATLFTSYFFDAPRTTPTWIVCGNTENTNGCYGAGTLGTFGKIGAMMEGYPRTDLSTNTVTRAIYVLDIAAGANQNEVILYVYSKSDVITPDFDTVTVTLTNTIPLDLAGGLSSKGFMAANKNFILLGTNRSRSALELDKKAFTVTSFGPYTEFCSSITSDQYGYMTADFGQSLFFQVGPDGKNLQGGGGAWFMLNPMQGVPATLP
ncbi:MAG: hypothetical protein ABIU29_03730 [Chthoniobacterales bacterium]